MIKKTARRYIGGTTAQEAVETAGTRPFILGYWEAAGEPAHSVAQHYEGAAAAIAGRDAYLAVRPEAFDFDAALLAELGAPLHFDVRAYHGVDPAWSLVGRVPVRGVTLPGRWKRSVEDAARVADWGVAVRVVKGQFPSGDDVDPSAGFLAVVDRLVELGVERIALGTHDPVLFAEARRRAPAAELEHMRGTTPIDPSCRVYVPYAAAYLPYAVRYVRERSRGLLSLAR